MMIDKVSFIHGDLSDIFCVSSSHYNLTMNFQYGKLKHNGNHL